MALPLGDKVILISYTKGVWEEGQGGAVAPYGPPLALPLSSAVHAFAMAWGLVWSLLPIMPLILNLLWHE